MGMEKIKIICDPYKTTMEYEYYKEGKYETFMNDEELSEFASHSYNINAHISDEGNRIIEELYDGIFVPGGELCIEFVGTKEDYNVLKEIVDKYNDDIVIIKSDDFYNSIDLVEKKEMECYNKIEKIFSGFLKTVGENNIEKDWLKNHDNDNNLELIDNLDICISRSIDEFDRKINQIDDEFQRRVECIFTEMHKLNESFSDGLAPVSIIYNETNIDNVVKKDSKRHVDMFRNFLAEETTIDGEDDGIKDILSLNECIMRCFSMITDQTPNARMDEVESRFLEVVELNCLPEVTHNINKEIIEKYDDSVEIFEDKCNEKVSFILECDIKIGDYVNVDSEFVEVGQNKLYELLSTVISNTVREAEKKYIKNNGKDGVSIQNIVPYIEKTESVENMLWNSWFWAIKQVVLDNNIKWSTFRSLFEEETNRMSQKMVYVSMDESIKEKEKTERDKEKLKRLLEKLIGLKEYKQFREIQHG